MTSKSKGQFSKEAKSNISSLMKEDLNMGVRQDDEGWPQMAWELEDITLNRIPGNVLGDSDIARITGE